ncbi:conjugal transfer protein TraH [Aliivibrio fischeri]|uniref:conjugal transfer protein TraH n=1 Tax=Aliivibrio fischeri TaxID=668 RepID=UPI0012D9487C|nr:conjugal transfer protein TraH [Aliivibrio fischeri]MUJ20392.1 hypothetical protein [Aliivibrio fischeri]
MSKIPMNLEGYKSSYTSKTVISSLVALSLTFPSYSNASLADMVNEIYGGSVTDSAPSSYQISNGRQSFNGGAVSIRFRPKSFNVVNFQAPSASIGCGGIDFFAGSIDIMSKDELVQVGRNIAAAATAYAFRLSLNSICSSCMSIMSNIQEMMDQINRIAKADCNTALKAMENFHSSSPSEKDAAVKGSLADKTGEWVETLTATPASDHWLKWVMDEGRSMLEIADTKEIVSGMGNLTYYVGANTDLPNILFPFLSDEERLPAFLSVFQIGDSCPQVDNATKGGGEPNEGNCSFPVEDSVRLSHSFRAFFVGEQSDDNGRLSVPFCKENNVTSYSLKNGNDVTVCMAIGDSATKSPFGIMPNQISPIKEGFYKAAFGDVFTKGVYTEGLVDTLCKNNQVNITKQSLFTKILTYNSSAKLTPDELRLASNLGTKYVVDLYRMNEKGETVSDRSDTGCGQALSALRDRVVDVVRVYEDGASLSLDRALRHIEDDPAKVLPPEVKEKIKARLILEMESFKKAQNNEDATKARLKKQGSSIKQEGAE